MLERTPELNRTIRYCERWGAKVFLEEYDKYSLLYLEKGPIHGGLDWNHHQIWFPLDSPVHSQRQNVRHVEPTICVALLHELAHVLCSEPPNFVCEPDSEMLAFEYYSVRKLKIPGWSLFMNAYGMPDGEDWENLHPLQKHKWISNSAVAARDEGLLDINNQPTFEVPWLRKEKHRGRKSLEGSKDSV